MCIGLFSCVAGLFSSNCISFHLVSCAEVSFHVYRSLFMCIGLFYGSFAARNCSTL